MKEWSKKVFAIIGSVLVVCLSLCSFSFTSNAANTSVYVVDSLNDTFCPAYARPSASGGNSFASVVFKSSTNNNYQLFTYVVNVSCASNTGTDSSDVYTELNIGSGVLKFIMNVPTGATGSYSIMLYGATGQVGPLKTGSFTTTATYNVSISSDYAISTFYSDNLIVTNNTLGAVKVPNINWGSSSEYSAIFDIISELSALNSSVDGVSSDIETILARVTAIANSVDTVETKLLNIYNYLADKLPLVISRLDSLNTTLNGVKTDTSNIYKVLQDIYNLLLESSGSQESIPAPPTDTMNDYYAAEDGLMLGDDISDSMTNADANIDASSNDLVWHIVNKFLSANPIIMNLITVVCAAGLGALILGR